MYCLQHYNMYFLHGGEMSPAEQLEAFQLVAGMVGQAAAVEDLAPLGRHLQAAWQRAQQR